MSDAKHTTKDNKKNPEHHVDVAIRRLQIDKTVPPNNHSQTMIIMNTISDLKRPTAPKIRSKHNDAKDCKEKCCRIWESTWLSKPKNFPIVIKNIQTMLPVLRFKNGRNSASFLKLCQKLC